MQSSNSPRLITNRLIAVIATLAVLLSTTAIAAAETPDELRKKRKEVQAEEAALATDIDVVESEAADVQGALDAVQRDVDSQAAAVEAAQRRVMQAGAATAAAQARVDELEELERQAKDRMQAQAIEAYVSFQGPSSSISLLNDDPWQQAREASLVRFATGTELDTLDELRSIGAELEDQRRLADEAQQEARQVTSDLQLQLTTLASARDRQNEIVDRVNERLDDKLAELVSLQAVDSELAADIRREEQKIADAVAARNNPGSGSFTIPDDLTIDLTSVRGIRVNVVIADRLEGLLAAMSAKGFVLGGGGYRSPQSQIDLRRQHCGTSDYAIWRMPASRCRPPTAPPGRSEHERGLAIDFTYNGRALRSRRSEVFKALKEVALQFGFENLPSEPWHWSVDGT